MSKYFEDGHTCLNCNCLNICKTCEWSSVLELLQVVGLNVQMTTFERNWNGLSADHIPLLSLSQHCQSTILTGSNTDS